MSIDMYELTAKARELHKEIAAGRKVSAIKLIRSIADCGLKEAVEIYRAFIPDGSEPHASPPAGCLDFDTDHIVVSTSEDGYDQYVAEFPNRGEALDYAEKHTQHASTITVAKVIARSERVTTIKIVG